MSEHHIDWSKTTFDGSRYERFRGAQSMRYPLSFLFASTYARRTALILVWYPLPCNLNQSSTSSSTRSVICAFFTTGFSPLRWMALANCSGVISGASDMSMSSSRIASTRFQSVSFPELRSVFEEEFLLIFGGLTNRDDTDEVRAFSVDNYGDVLIEQAERYQALFAIWKSSIFDREGFTVEDRFTSGEVDAVAANIETALFLVPVEFQSVVTNVVTVKGSNTFRSQSFAKPICTKRRDAAVNSEEVHQCMICCGSREIAQKEWNRYGV